MSYQRKTKDRWDIMTNWGYGWECENSEYTRADAKRSLREAINILNGFHVKDYIAIKEREYAENERRKAERDQDT